MQDPAGKHANPQAADRVVVIGAGPGGLTAAYLLAKRGVTSVVLEKDDQVGGLSRTVRHNGYYFDIGGHRFFTKVQVVEDLWHELLGPDEFLLRKRLSRIYFNGRFFSYPLRAANAVFGLGPWTSLTVLLSYAWVQLFPVRDERTFEDWVTNRFGRRLYEIFFKSYTEKVWGIPCSELSAAWAAQRIKGLSLVSAVRNALLPSSAGAKGDVIKTLIDAFHYPRRGPGQMWETVAEKIEGNGSQLRLSAEVERIEWAGDQVVAVDVLVDGQRERITGSHFVSTMPLGELIAKSDPPPPKEVVAAAARLNYRDFLTVALIVNEPDLFPDNWIYVHDSKVKVGRVQNFKNWSPDMVPDQGKTCVGLEYFCFEGDELWTASDEELIALGTREMEQIGLVRAADVEGGAVVRMPKAYPVYDGDYSAALEIVRRHVSGLTNLHPIGRNGMHKYNNQDHSMLTAILAVENIQGADHDVWKVNVDSSYHEELSRGHDEARKEPTYPDLAATQPQVPMPIAAGSQAIIRKAFARLAPVPFGVAVGAVGGLYAFLATATLLLKGGQDIGQHLALLGQYFPGYHVSWSGSVVGALYMTALGFAAGWLVAVGRNLQLRAYLQWIQRQEEARSLEEP